MTPPLDAALAYAARGWPVFPVRADKHPLTKHGLLDATVDPEIIREWFTRWPGALAAIATGMASGVVGLDVDIREEGSGLDTLDDLGVSVHPATPTAHTPSGGVHMLFRWPGRYVKTCSGRLGPYVDIRGDAGSLILPPGPKRFWDPHLGPDSPLAAMPTWMVIAEPEQQATTEPVQPTTGLSPYAQAALNSACRRILTAPAGEQEATINGEAFAIGTLAGAGGIPADFAFRTLIWAARQIPDHDARRPWRVREIEAKVDRAFDDGMRQPREARHG